MVVACGWNNNNKNKNNNNKNKNNNNKNKNNNNKNNTNKNNNNNTCSPSMICLKSLAPATVVVMAFPLFLPAVNLHNKIIIIKTITIITITMRIKMRMKMIIIITRPWSA